MKAMVEIKKRIEVNSKREAWEKVDEIFPTDYIKDEKGSEMAGYPIYRSTADGHFYDYICDLNDRLEVNLSNGNTVNVWFSEIYWERVEMRTRISKLEDELENEKTEIFFLNREKEMLSNENAELKEKVEDLQRMVEYFRACSEECTEKLEAIKALLK